jgi:hypothetical protein
MTAISALRGAGGGLRGAVHLRRVADQLGLIKFDPPFLRCRKRYVAAANSALLQSVCLLTLSRYHLAEFSP